MPRGPAALTATTASVFVGRYVLATEGSRTMLYDLLELRAREAPPLPRPARSLATARSAVVAIDETGATALDLADGTSYPVTAPAGGTFAEVAGGTTVVAPDGTQLLVGATRVTGGPTARVLVVSPSGVASFASLATPREGACATYVEGRGLVVVGGGDGETPGAEVLGPGASLATPLPFPANASKGCGLAALDTARVVLAGGSPEPRAVQVLDLACTTSCAPSAWGDALPLARAEAQAIAPDAVLLVGDDPTGATHVYRADPSGTREIGLRVPRRGARLVATPLGGAAVVGGGPGIEHYFE